MWAQHTHSPAEAQQAVSLMALSLWVPCSSSQASSATAACTWSSVTCAGLSAALRLPRRLSAAPACSCLTCLHQLNSVSQAVAVGTACSLVGSCLQCGEAYSSPACLLAAGSFNALAAEHRPPLLHGQPGHPSRQPEAVPAAEGAPPRLTPSSGPAAAPQLRLPATRLQTAPAGGAGQQAQRVAADRWRSGGCPQPRAPP